MPPGPVCPAAGREGPELPGLPDGDALVDGPDAPDAPDGGPFGAAGCEGPVLPALPDDEALVDGPDAPAAPDGGPFGAAGCEDPELPAFPDGDALVDGPDAPDAPDGGPFGAAGCEGPELPAFPDGDALVDGPDAPAACEGDGCGAGDCDGCDGAGLTVLAGGEPDDSEAPACGGAPPVPGGVAAGVPLCGALAAAGPAAEMVVTLSGVSKRTHGTASARISACASLPAHCSAITSGVTDVGAASACVTVMTRYRPTEMTASLPAARTVTTTVLDRTAGSLKSSVRRRATSVARSPALRPCAP